MSRYFPRGKHSMEDTLKNELKKTFPIIKNFRFCTLAIKRDACVWGNCVVVEGFGSFFVGWQWPGRAVKSRPHLRNHGPSNNTENPLLFFRSFHKSKQASLSKLTISVLFISSPIQSWYDPGKIASFSCCCCCCCC